MKMLNQAVFFIDLAEIFEFALRYGAYKYHLFNNLHGMAKRCSIKSYSECPASTNLCFVLLLFLNSGLEYFFLISGLEYCF